MHYRRSSWSRLAFFSGVLCRGIVIINLGMPNIIIVLNIIMQRITLLLRICIYTALHPGHRQREMLLEEPSLSPCLYNKSSSIRRSWWKLSVRECGLPQPASQPAISRWRRGQNMAEIEATERVHEICIKAPLIEAIYKSRVNWWWRLTKWHKISPIDGWLISAKRTDTIVFIKHCLMDSQRNKTLV